MSKPTGHSPLGILVDGNDEIVAVSKSCSQPQSFPPLRLTPSSVGWQPLTLQKHCC